MNFCSDDIRDWIYDNYQAAYCIGTGLLTLGAWALCPKKIRKASLFWGTYSAVLTLGALLEPCVNVSSSLYGEVFSCGLRDSRKIALTFDDGPHPLNTPQILDVLAQEKAEASFFCVGTHVLEYPDLVKKIKEGGHLLGSHSFSHCNFLGCTPSRARQEILEGGLALEAVLGEKNRYYRPPYGMRYPWNLKDGYDLRQLAVLWSNCPRDWQLPGAEVIAQRVISQAQSGDIVLLHDGGGDRSQTVAALPAIIRGLRQRGFQLVRVDQLL
ncbi:MAG: polysaccharide deacetylase family protein [Candidatus Bruticola sp.]